MTSIIKRNLFAAVCVFLAIITTPQLYANDHSTADSEELTPANFDLANYKGQVVYLDFWASWCGPCRMSFPVMNELQKEFGDKLKIIAVNVDNKRSDAERFLKKYPAEFSILYDHKGELATDYQLQGMPTSFYFNKQGEASGTHLGFRKDDAIRIREKIRHLVETPEEAASGAANEDFEDD